MKLQSLFTFFLVIAVAFMSGCVGTKVEKGAKVEKVINAGIAFAGIRGAEGEAMKRQKFPYISAMAQGGDLNKILSEKLEKSKSDLNFEILKSGDRLVGVNEGVASMAFVINFEKTFCVYRSEFKKYHLRIYVGAQALFFDFKTKSILASFPFMIVAQELMKEKPSEEQIAQVYKKIFGRAPYTVNDGMISDGANLNIFDFFIEKLGDIEPRRHYASTIGVGKFTINRADGYGKNIPFATDEDCAEFMVNSFNSSVYKKYKIPMVPYSPGGSTLYFQLLEDFRDSDDKLMNELAFEVPHATYKIDLRLSKLYNEYKERSYGKAARYNYFSQYEISLNETATNKVLIKSKKFGAATRKGGKPIHENEYLRCLIKLNNSLVKEMEDFDGLELLDKTLEKCR